MNESSNGDSIEIDFVKEFHCRTKVRLLRNSILWSYWEQTRAKKTEPRNEREWKSGTKSMKKVVTSVSTNNHEPSGRFHSTLTCRPLRVVNRESPRKAQMDMKKTWHYDGNFVERGKSELKMNRSPKHLDGQSHFPIDYVPSLLTFFLFFSICSYHNIRTHNKQDELPLVRWVTNVEFSYFAVCFC